METLDTKLHIQTKELISSIEEFREVANMLSTESVGSSFIATIKGYFVKRLSIMANAFNAHFGRGGSKSKSEYNRYLKELISLRSTVNQIKSKLKYSEVGTTKIITIIGLKVNLLVLTKTLVESSKLITTYLPKDLAELNEQISKILSDREYAKSVRPLTKVDDSYKKKLQTNLDSIIDTKKFQDTDLIENLIPSISSISDIIENILQAGDGHTLDQYEKLQDQVVAIKAKTEELLKLLAENPDMEISKQVYNNFVDKMSVTAEALTLSASFMHLVNQSAMVTKAIIDRLAKKL